MIEESIMQNAKGISKCRVCGERISYDGTGRIRICVECRSLKEPCKCGCGEGAPTYNPIGKRNAGYCLGHYSRLPEHKAKLASNRPNMKGFKMSEETRLLMSLSRRGCNNGNWKGGVTAVVRALRRSKEYRHWRKAVLVRDAFTCQACGSMEQVEAHHIQPVIEHPELVLVVANGMSLCRTCHKEQIQCKKRR